MRTYKTKVVAVPEGIYWGILAVAKREQYYGSKNSYFVSILHKWLDANGEESSEKEVNQVHPLSAKMIKKPIGKSHDQRKTA